VVTFDRYSLGGTGCLNAFVGEGGFSIFLFPWRFSMINMNCPQCGRPYGFDDVRLGAPEKCVQCGATFTIQRQQAASPPPFEQPQGYTPTIGPPPQYQPYPPPPYYLHYFPPPTNGSAVAALVLGIASLVMELFGIILGPIALYFAGRGIREIDTGAWGGRGLAVAGRVTGILGLIFGVLLVLLYVMIFALAFHASRYS
jgi:hypothetical protein